MKTVIISGITGQCGSYLAEQMLEKGYKVIGFSRRVSVNTLERLHNVVGHPNFIYREGDVTDVHFIVSILSEYKPVKFFNAAAMSHVATSFEQPDMTWQVDAQGVLNILNAIKLVSPETRLLQFSTSEMFGDQYQSKVEVVNGLPTNINYQNEDTLMNPQSPYAIAKLAGYHAVRLYREAYGLYASSAIFFNMESPRRGEKFVTRKVTKWVGGLKNLLDTGVPAEEIKKMPKLQLGNLDAKRDWGFCPEYMQAADLILDADKPDDFVVATGETHSIRELLTAAFGAIGLNWEEYVEVNQDFIRPAEVPYLCGDPGKIKRELGWNPNVKFSELIKIMVESEQ